MGGGSTSRLYESLVKQQKLATTVSMSYESDAWDDTEIWISAALAPGADPEKLDAAIQQQLRIVSKNGITASELEDAKNRMQAAAIYARDSLEGPALIFGLALTTGSTLEDVEYWPEKVAAVTTEQVNKTAQEWLNPDSDSHRPVTGYLLPAIKSSVQTLVTPVKAQEVAP